MISFRFGVILVALIMVTAVACGGDDDDDSPAATSTEAEDAVIEATATPVQEDTDPTETDQESETGDTEDSEGSAQIVEPPERSDDIPQNGRTLGNPDASVVFSEFGDFQ